MNTQPAPEKETNPKKHKRLTGVDNKLIIENLRFIDDMGKNIVLRCPIIPTVNDTEEHFSGIAVLSESLKNITETVIEPYHSFGEGKYTQLGRSYELTCIQSPADETVEKWISQIQTQTSVKITRA
jgi:pyruvate formate lyase activating enzyme